MSGFVPEKITGSFVPNKVTSINMDVVPNPSFMNVTWPLGTEKEITFCEGSQATVHYLDACSDSNASAFEKFLDCDNVAVFGNARHSRLSLASASCVIVLDNLKNNEQLKAFFTQMKRHFISSYGAVEFRQLTKDLGVNFIGKNCANDSNFMQRFHQLREKFVTENMKGWVAASAASEKLIPAPCCQVAADALEVWTLFTATRNGKQQHGDNTKRQRTRDPRYTWSPEGETRSQAPAPPPQPPARPTPEMSAEDQRYLQSIAGTIDLHGVETTPTETVSEFHPIDLSRLRTNQPKGTGVDAQFWSDLESLDAVMHAKMKVDTDGGSYMCKICKKKCKTYVKLLQHCWETHKEFLDNM